MAAPLHDAQRHDGAAHRAHVDLRDVVVHEHGEPAQRPRRGVAIAPPPAQSVVRAALRAGRVRRRPALANPARVHGHPALS